MTRRSKRCGPPTTSFRRSTRPASPTAGCSTASTAATTSGRASLRLIDPEKQKIVWQKEDFGYATLLKADGKILAQKTDGTLVLFRCDPERYVELASAQVFTVKTFALPALSAGRLYVRDDHTLKCLDVHR